MRHRNQMIVLTLLGLASCEAAFATEFCLEKSGGPVPDQVLVIREPACTQEHGTTDQRLFDLPLQSADAPFSDPLKQKIMLSVCNLGEFLQPIAEGTPYVTFAELNFGVDVYDLDGSAQTEGRVLQLTAVLSPSASNASYYLLADWYRASTPEWSMVDARLPGQLIQSDVLGPIKGNCGSDFTTAQIAIQMDRNLGLGVGSTDWDGQPSFVWSGAPLPLGNLPDPELGTGNGLNPVRIRTSLMQMSAATPGGVLRLVWWGVDQPLPTQ